MAGWQIWGVRWGRFQNRRSVLRKKFVEFETMSSRMSIWSVLPPRDAECDVFPFSSCIILVGVCPRNCKVDVTCVGEGNLLQLALGIGERRRLLLYPFSRVRCFAKLCPEIKLGRYHKGASELLLFNLSCRAGSVEERQCPSVCKCHSSSWCSQIRRDQLLLL